LPKFSDSVAYKKLAKIRGIKLPMPRQLMDHGPVLAEIAQHREFSDNWYVEMLFFSKEWLTEQNTESWKTFYLYLLQEGWNMTEYWRNKIAYDLVWNLFVKKLAQKGLKVSPRTVDIVKHLVALSLGALPGFSPAIDDETAPIKELQHEIQK